MPIYCTLFDRNYFTRGLALYYSLSRHVPDSKLLILCLDRATLDALTALSLPRAEAISLDTLEAGDAQLSRARGSRSAIEYYFTCKPALMSYAFKRFSSASRITYLDADLSYFSDPRPLEQTYLHSSVTLSPHRFPERLAARRQFGEFNAGWISAGADAEGQRFLQWWRERCIEWCRYQVDGDRFADQKYLDQVPRLFSNVTLLAHPGANTAPWNLSGAAVTRSADGIRIGSAPLVFFHFHGLRRVLYRLYDSGLLAYGVKLTPEARAGIFRPYMADLSQASASLARLPAPIRGPVSAMSSMSGMRERLRALRLVARLLLSGTALLGP